MGSIRKYGAVWQVTFRNKALLGDTTRTVTCHTEVEAERVESAYQRSLDAGIVPYALSGKSVGTVGELVERYLAEASYKAADAVQLKNVRNVYGTKPVGVLSAGAWVQEFVSAMQAEKKAPSTIRKYVGSLSRCYAWALRLGMTVGDNALELLPKGYATYKGCVSGERDRRLEEGEEEKIRAFLEADNPAECLLFELALETAMRMSEMHTLEVRQVDFAKRTIFLEKTKNGDKRQVPMSSVAMAKLKEWLAGRKDGYVFPWYEKYNDAAATTNHLSYRWRRACENAGVVGLHFHDLRHEATARLYERTQLSDLQIAKITGHKDMKMLARYANLRGSDLASALW